MHYIAGIDLGTSSVKVLLTDRTGKQVGFSQNSYEVSMPQISWAEQSPLDWWKATIDALSHALQGANISPSQIRCIGLSGQMHGLVALNKDKIPVQPAMIWMDQRANKELDWLQETVTYEYIASETGNHPAAGFLLSSLLWTKRNRPEVYEEIAYVMLPKDYIRFRLTGEISSDYSDASGSLCYDVKQHQWASHLLERIGIDPSLFPRVSSSCEIAGYMTKTAAEETGLAVHTPVACGGADQPMQLLGNGAIREGLIASNIGTASQISMSLSAPRFDPAHRTQTFCHARDDLWFIQGASLNGGSILNWLKNQILQSKIDYADFDRLAETIAPGADGLLFLPYLNGERTPHMDSKARGMLFGLAAKHDHRHMIRAAMEGIVFALKDALTIFQELGMQSEYIIASGGGGKSHLWRQMQADISNLPVYTTKVKEEACTGAAICAAVAAGFYADLSTAAEQFVEINPEVITPITKNHTRYQELYEVYRQLYERNKDLFPLL